MPAVTVSDVLSLPAVVPNSGDNERPVRSVTTAQSGFEGEGFPVRRAFTGVSLDQLDPFIHLDQMGEVEYAPGEPKGTPWHPHRGFETVTYMIDGTFEHQDSQGGGGLITNGDTQWMTAGSGLLHIEKPPESLVMSGGLFHGFQLWVNLPSKDKFLAPRYQDLRAGEVVLVRSPDGGSLLRVIAGEVGEPPGSGIDPHADHHGARHPQPGAQLRLPWRAGLQLARLRPERQGSIRGSATTGRNGSAGRFRARAIRSRSRPTRSRRAAAPSSTCSSSGASRSASRWPGTGRS